VTGTSAGEVQLLRIDVATDALQAALTSVATTAVAAADEKKDVVVDSIKAVFLTAKTSHDQTDKIYSVDASTGQHSVVNGDDWTNGRHLIRTADGIVIVANTIWTMKANGSYSKLNADNWATTIASARLGDISSHTALLVTKSGGLYRLDVNNGHYDTLAKDGWDSTTNLISISSGVIAMCKKIWHVDNKGAYRKISDQDWSSAKASALIGNEILVALANGSLHAVNALDGQSRVLIASGFTATHMIAVSDRALVFDGHSVRSVDNAGHLSVVNPKTELGHIQSLC